METKILKTKGDRFVEATIRYADGRLSVTGCEGRIVQRRIAKAEARRHWESFFEEMPEEIISMNQRCGTKFTSASGAARYVLKVDGEFHGLDVHTEDGNKVLLTESCGCIHDTIKEWFPELAPLIPWHLNDLHAGCEHQDSLGWGHGHDVALSKDELTPAQREILLAECHKRGEEVRARELSSRLNRLDMDRGYRLEVLKGALGRTPSLSDEEESRPAHWLGAATRRGVRGYLEQQVASVYPDPQIESTIYKDSLGAPCPTCGYRYGSAWRKRELPPEVIAQVNALSEGQKGAQT